MLNSKSSGQMLQGVPAERRYRYEFFKLATEMNLPENTMLMLTEPMRGKSEEEKEAMAAALVKILQRAKDNE